MVADNQTGPKDPLFSYGENGNLSGHSFRVGGATLRWNDKKPLEEIMAIGRWQSKAYELYLRKYTREEKEDTKEWWKLLDTYKLYFGSKERKGDKGKIEQKIETKGKGRE